MADWHTPKRSALSDWYASGYFSTSSSNAALLSFVGALLRVAQGAMFRSQRNKLRIDISKWSSVC